MVLGTCSMHSLPSIPMTGQAQYTLLEDVAAKEEREEEILCLPWVTLCWNTCRKDVGYWILRQKKPGFCRLESWGSLILLYGMVQATAESLPGNGTGVRPRALLCGVPLHSPAGCLQQGSWSSSFSGSSRPFSPSSLGDITELVQKLLWGEINNCICP